MSNNTTSRRVFLIVALALFLRTFNFSFPAFTTDEARIASRGYELYTKGVDELGRKLPFLFNSLNDYQLPVTSYISALGGIFGKSELGARTPFILIGLILMLLTYKVATLLSREKSFHILSAFIVATSPVLIFVSKIPNESIVAAVLFLFLFYLLNRDKLNISYILLTIILLILTSKSSWFILTPFIIYTVFIYSNNLSMKVKLKVSLISFILTILAFAFFLQVPQGTRSLSENNLSLFSNLATKNGIDWIRGQGLESGWPPILERILISKAHFFLIGILHWLSNIQPAVLFGQFSKDGNLGFFGLGAFPKVTIIPALMGLIFLIKERKSKLLAYPVIITLPAALIYPQFSPQVVILTLPFIAYVIAFGLFQAQKMLRSLIIFFMILELLINFFFLSSQINITSESRPYWIKPIMQDVSKTLDADQVFISDNIAQDPASFIEWLTPLQPQMSSLNLSYPYKFRQTNFGKIKFLGLSDNLRACKLGEKNALFVTKRDLERMRKISANNVVRTYLDNRGLVVVYLMKEEVCIN